VNCLLPHDVKGLIMKGIKGENPAFPFYIKDWLTDPQLRMARFITKGVWIDLLCIMWKSKPRGEITGTEEQIRRLLGATEEELSIFLEDAKFLKFCDIICQCHKTSHDCPEIVTIRNRRMRREDKIRTDARYRKRNQRQKAKNDGGSHGSHTTVTTASPSPIPSPSEIKKEPSLFLSNFLLEKITERNPKFKRPDLRKWGVNVDRMIRIDKRDPKEIMKVIEWVQADDFWQNNILSTLKLRKQYDQLFMKMNKAKNPYGL